MAAGACAALRLRGTVRMLDAQANRDPLTDLANWRAFERRLSAPPGEGGSTLLLVDLYGFKDTYGTFGHPAGDMALRKVARRLAATARQGDVAYRPEGDEFALVLPEALPEHRVLAIGERIHAALANPFTIEDSAVPLRAPIGAAVLPRRGVGSGCRARAPRRRCPARREARGLGADAAARRRSRPRGGGRARRRPFTA